MTDTSVVVLCPGQGAQIAGMGTAWAERFDAARAVFDEADAVLGDSLGSPLSALCFDGPQETLDRTNVSQPAIYTASVACFRGLEQRDGAVNIAATAGLSLGEYTALHLADVFSFADGLKLVAARGRLMQDAAERGEGGMVALSGNVDEATVEQLCDECRGDDVLVPANFNSSMQVVVSGSKSACQRAEAKAGDYGLKATALPVAGAFHSPLMEPAAEAMRTILRETPLAAPSVPVWSNVTGKQHGNGQNGADSELLAERLVQQIVSPVRWHQLCLDLADFGKTPRGGSGGNSGGDSGGGGSTEAAAAVQWIELGPRATLRGLMKRIDRTIKVTSHEEP